MIKKSVSDKDIEASVLLIGDPRWQPGLLGLAAQRAVELYDKPVCVWGRGDANDVKGSCRSDGSVDVVSLLSSASDVLLDYGGHKHSGGFSVATDNVHILRDVLSSYDTSQASADEKAKVDTHLSIGDVSWETYSQIEQLAPFGVGNPKPLFLLTDAMISSTRRFGTGNAHFEVLFDSPSGRTVKALQFFAPKSMDDQCEKGKKINMHAHLERSFFAGKPELRLRIVDVL